MWIPGEEQMLPHLQDADSLVANSPSTNHAYGFVEHLEPNKAVKGVVTLGCAVVGVRNAPVQN